MQTSPVLWSPHAMMAEYAFNSIQLPAYSPAGFEAGQTDYTSEVIEKMASKWLAGLSPRVNQLYARFMLDNRAQEGMLAAMDHGLSVMEAACAWLHDSEATWKEWVPPGSASEEGGSCSIGECCVSTSDVSAINATKHRHELICARAHWGSQVSSLRLSPPGVTPMTKQLR
jgi:hypothetical protein